MRVTWWLAALAVVFAAGAATAPAAAAVPANVQHLVRAEFVRGPDPAAPAQRSEAAPPADAAWEAVALPHRWWRSDNRTLATAWYRIAFDAPDPPPADLALYVPRMGNGGVVFVNGHAAGSVRASDEDTQVRWGAPHLLALPQALLVPGRNELLLHVVSRDAQNGLSDLQVGPADAVHSAWRWHSLLVYEAAEMSAAFTAITGFFMLVVWLFRRNERLYLYFGVGCLAWAVRTLPFVVQVLPYEWWWPWRALYFLATGVFTLAMGGFFLELAHVAHRRWDRLALAWSLFGPLVVLASAGRLEDLVLRWWQGVLFVLMGYALARFAVALWRRPAFDSVLLTIAVAIAVALAALDFGSAVGYLSYARAYRLHLGAPLLLVAMGAILTLRFVRALQAAEQANAQLERRIADREHALAAQFERLRDVERSQARSAERHRIMQDIHDGLGSQLVTSLMLIEHGQASRDDIAAVLREAIDDLRLAIDGMEGEGAELAGALAGLRHRMEPRLRAAGITLQWDVAGESGAAPLSAHGALQVLRLVQEALTNAMRHAGARRIRVSVTHSPVSVHVEVADDGRGFAVSSSAPGRGLSNMHRRARELGAGLSVRSGDDGTVIALSVPLSMRPAAGTGQSN